MELMDLSRDNARCLCFPEYENQPLEISTKRKGL